MKTVAKNPRSNGVTRVRSRLWWVQLCAVAILLAFGSTARAQLTVNTLGGGPSQANPSSYSGFADGNTLQTAQFNLPSGLAVDPSSRYLYVADTANNAVRRLDLTAGTTTTFEIISNGTTYGNVWNIPVDVAVDTATNIYILTKGDGKIIKIDAYSNLSTNPVVLTAPNAMALDANGVIYVVEAGGSLKKVNPTTGAVTVLAGPGTFNAPMGVEVMDTGTIVVSDTGVNALWTVDPNSHVISLLAGTPGVSGGNDGPLGVAQFSAPRGIAKAGNNILVVADYGNNQVRQVNVSSRTTTTLFGVPTVVWSSLPEGAPYYPGWADGLVSVAEVRGPAGVVVDGNGNVYDSEQFYDLIRRAINTGLTGPGGTTSGGGTNVVLNPPSLTISPNTGYFPMGQTITVTSTSTNIFYTTDGTTPTTNSTPVVMNGGQGSILWSNPTNDLTRLQVAAFITSGTNSASTNLTGLAATASTIGVPTTINTNLLAGIGSTVVVPVVANLRSIDTVKSFQFDVEVTPNGAAPAIVASQFHALNIGSNDFVRVATVAQGSSAATFTTIPYTIPPSTAGLAITALGTNANVSFQHFAVVAMLAIPIPGGAAEGQSYNISISHVSATSDGQQTSVPITANADLTITVTNIAYLVGDSAPGRWYNAGDFGDGNLANNDVNNVFNASLGFAVPYSFTDVFDSMDAWPVDQPGVAGGDGQIRYNDLQVILLRSLRLPPYTGGGGNWKRALSTGGNRTNNVATIAANSPVAKLISTPPGSVWNRQSTVGAIPVGNLQAGGQVSLPVYVQLAGGSTLAGFQFRAIVDAVNGAPALTNQVQFTAAAGIPNPTITIDSTFINQVGCTWNFNSISFASQSSNLVGYVTFQIPGNAVTGQSYWLHFSHADGAPPTGDGSLVPNAQYDFDTISAAANVGVPASAAHIMSDEWIIHFFGSLDNPLAAPNADPDGDGIPNWQEYLLGTDPTNPSSQLVLGVVVVTSQNSVTVQWLTAPGKVYALESTPSLITPVWTTVTTVTGDGNYKQITEPNNNDGTKFYRVRLVP